MARCQIKARPPWQELGRRLPSNASYLTGLSSRVSVLPTPRQRVGSNLFDWRPTWSSGDRVVTVPRLSTMLAIDE